MSGATTSRPVPGVSLQPLAPGDRSWIEPLLDGAPSELGTRTFTGVYIWREHFDYAWTWIDGYFCLFARYGPHTYMPWPPLPGPAADPGRFAAVVGTAFEVMAASPDQGSAARIEAVDQWERPSFEAAGYEVVPHATEYVYQRQALVELRGNAYKSKRWAWNDFVKQQVFTLDPLADRHVPECLALYRRWRDLKARRTADDLARAMAEDAESAHRIAVTERDALGLRGLVVTIEGRVAGYTLGGAVRPDLFGVWLEIADPERRGLATYLFREFCRAQTGVEWITALDDSGLASLANAKRSYRPARLVHSFLVRRRG
ncbi:MAG TPA: phosphatidylglycerol lysyltransferase domain-containing protein [Nitrospiria bacterium]|nr:phosphatidylglycerol lysyltransferase domain-containing protein [Nitrospiria bacterium]